MVKIKVSTSESKNRTQTKEVKISDLVSVNRVTSSTGTVSYDKINDTTLKLTFKNGSYSRRVQTGGQYIPGKSKYVTNQSSRNYSDSDGYSGTLDAYIYSGEYIPPKTKYVTNQSSSNYRDSEGYTGRLEKYLHSGSIVPGKTKKIQEAYLILVAEPSHSGIPHTLDYPMVLASSGHPLGYQKFTTSGNSFYYNKNGFKGTLNQIDTVGGKRVFIREDIVNGKFSVYANDIRGIDEFINDFKSKYDIPIVNMNSQLFGLDFTRIKYWHYANTESSLGYQDAFSRDNYGSHARLYKRINSDLGFPQEFIDGTSYVVGGGGIYSPGVSRVSFVGDVDSTEYGPFNLKYEFSTKPDEYRDYKYRRLYTIKPNSEFKTSTRTSMHIVVFEGEVKEDDKDTRVYRYRGDVTKPAEDTRVYKYQGTVSTPSKDTRTYDYYYKYSAEIDYSSPFDFITIKLSNPNIREITDDSIGVIVNIPDNIPKHFDISKNSYFNISYGVKNGSSTIIRGYERIDKVNANSNVLELSEMRKLIKSEEDFIMTITLHTKDGAVIDSVTTPEVFYRGMEIFVKTNGTWKESTDVFVKTNGTWKKALDAYIKISNNWRQT